jgi:excisionase family DNA binding protein
MRRTARQDNPANRNEPVLAGAKVGLLTVAQVAAQTQISVRQLRRMIKAGALPVTRFGRAVRVRPRDVGL